MKCIGPFFHKWGKWSVLSSWAINAPPEIPGDKKRMVGQQHVQTRECAKCGKKEFLTEKIWT